MVLLAIEWSKLAQASVASLVAGVGVTLFFSLVIYGGSKAADARRAGRGGTATLFGAMAIASGIVFAAGIVLGVMIIVSK